MTQKEFLSKLCEDNPNGIIFGSLGTISRDLDELNRGINIKGAMGCVMGIGLGYALNTKKKVIVIVGEGSFLMKLGSIATINKYRPINLEIIILINNKYESCGGQENNCGNIFSSELQNLNKRTYQVHQIS